MKLKLLALSCLFVSQFANAGQAVVYWEDTKKFTDIEAGVNTQSKFANRLKKSFSENFGDLAEQLPAGYKWEIQVHDVDLAGKVTNIYRNDRGAIRVYDQFFSPSVKISYRVVDAAGKVVANDKHFSVNNNYVDRFPARRTMQKFLAYEKHMINKWFDNVLLPFVEQQS